MGYTGITIKGGRATPEQRKSLILEEISHQVLEYYDTGKGVVYCAVVGSTGIFGAVVLYHNKPGEIMIKVMSEDEGPLYYDCPQSILRRLTAPPTGYGLIWRNNCQRVINIKAKKEARKLFA